MKIMLIYPDTDPLSIIPKKLINIEPLGLEYIAGVLTDHDVEILDMKTESRWELRLAEFQPDVVGISGTVIHTYRMIEVLDKAKEMHPETLTIVGGTHATLMPNDFDHPAVDLVIPGFGTDAVVECVRRFGQRRTFKDVSGVACRDNGRLRFNSPRQTPRDLNHLPMPRRDLTARYRKKYFHLVWKPTALIVSSVGCPSRCSFCPCPVLTNGRYLKRSPELVVQELEEISEPYIYAGDDNFFFDYKHALEIQRLISSSGIAKQYYILSRADEITRHPDLVEKWAEIGLKKVFLGLESINNEELQSLNKKCSVDKNNRAIEILHTNGVDPLGAFIIQPHYTKKDFDDLLRYMDRMRIYYHEFTIMTPFPGTAFYNQVRDEILQTDRRIFDLAHSVLPTSIPADEFYRLLSRLYRRAHSPVRALRIKPNVSPFKRFRFLRLVPGITSLFLGAKRAYRTHVTTAARTASKPSKLTSV